MKKKSVLFLAALTATFWVCVQLAFAYESKRPQQRVLYQQAEELQAKGKWAQYQKLLPKLKGYPLTPYLEYKALSKTLWLEKPEKIREFITLNRDSPLANRIERDYLFMLARNARWADFLAFYPKEPSNTSLRCYYFNAKLNTGKKAEALQGAHSLWLYGRSRPKACDPLFTAYIKSGQLTTALIWQRMELAFAARQYSLMTYLQKMLPAAEKKRGELLLKTYSNPHELLNFGLYSEEKKQIHTMVSLGVIRLAKKDLQQARTAWKHYKKWLNISNDQRRSVELELVKRALLSKETKNLKWADKKLAQWKDVKLVEWRIRIALKELDWAEVSQWIFQLPKERQQKDVWRYWQARSAEELGQTTSAHQAYRQLATERSFYGFMAADKLKQPYQLNERKLADGAPKKSLATLPGIIRIEELLLLGEDKKARIEWVTLIAKRSEDELLELGQLALDRDWHHFAVLATIEAKAWDMLSMRFPKAEYSSFSHFADQRQLALSYLYAIARQESALNPTAKSHAGARGLMQLMPATAKETARKIGFAYASREQLLDPDVNIRLGSAYIDQLLQQYNGNRILATAAYNAGPHRVKRWRNNNHDAGVPADVWVETIPFRETRGYVKNVLSFNLIYDHFLADSANRDNSAVLFKPEEAKLTY